MPGNTPKVGVASTHRKTHNCNNEEFTDLDVSSLSYFESRSVRQVESAGCGAGGIFTFTALQAHNGCGSLSSEKYVRYYFPRCDPPVEYNAGYTPKKACRPRLNNRDLVELYWWRSEFYADINSMKWRGKINSSVAKRKASAILEQVDNGRDDWYEERGGGEVDNGRDDWYEEGGGKESEHFGTPIVVDDNIDDDTDDDGGSDWASDDDGSDWAWSEVDAGFDDNGWVDVDDTVHKGGFSYADTIKRKAGGGVAPRHLPSVPLGYERRSGDEKSVEDDGADRDAFEYYDAAKKMRGGNPAKYFKGEGKTQRN